MPREHQLEYEYRRYQYVIKILTIVKKSSVSNYEARNIVERWLLTMVNFSSDMIDEVFSNDVTSSANYINKQMAAEIREKSKKNDNIGAIIRAIIDIVNQYKKIHPADAGADGSYSLIDGIFTYKDYSREIAPDRIHFLQTRATNYQIARMLMRYACILPGSQHWNMPIENFRLYYDAGITIEGFASPVNAQLILIDPNCQFCSLFPDVDAPFGSIGNFFTTDFIGKKASVGPPYTVELFEKIAKKLEAQCAAANNGCDVTFYVTFAAWEDTWGFKAIRDSKYCRAAYILPKYKHYYVNTNMIDQPRVTATFNTVFFDVGTASSVKTDYVKLFTGMAVGNLTLQKL